MTEIRIPSWLARLIMVLLVIVVIAIGIFSILLVPVVLAIALIIYVVRVIVTGGRAAITDTRQCPACGFLMTGQGDRGVCPNCNTIFGVDLEVRQERTADESPEFPMLPPAERDERRPAGP